MKSDEQIIAAYRDSGERCGLEELVGRYVGKVRGMVYPMVLDQTLADDEEIVFEAGTHREAIKMAYGDYVALVHPSVQRFAKAA